MDGRSKAYLLFLPLGIIALILITVGLGGQGWFVIKDKIQLNEAFGLDPKESVSITMGLWRLCAADKCMNLIGGDLDPGYDTYRSGIIYLQVPMVLGEICTLIGVSLILLVMFLYAKDSMYEGTNVFMAAGIFFLIGAGNVGLAVIRGGIANTEIRALEGTLLSVETPWAIVLSGVGGALLFVLGICTIVFACKKKRGLSVSAGDRVVLTQRVV